MTSTCSDVVFCRATNRVLDGMVHALQKRGDEELYGIVHRGLLSLGIKRDTLFESVDDGGLALTPYAELAALEITQTADSTGSAAWARVRTRDVLRLSGFGEVDHGPASDRH